MAKKKNDTHGGLVYSTNPDANLFNDNEESVETLAKEKQKLRVLLDTKQRAGKIVTMVVGFVGNSEDLEALGKQLKTKCGTGGTVKDGEVIIQGNYKDKVTAWLKEWGYLAVK